MDKPGPASFVHMHGGCDIYQPSAGHYIVASRFLGSVPNNSSLAKRAVSFLPFSTRRRPWVSSKSIGGCSPPASCSWSPILSRVVSWPICRPRSSCSWPPQGWSEFSSRSLERRRGSYNSTT